MVFDYLEEFVVIDLVKLMFVLKFVHLVIQHPMMIEIEQQLIDYYYLLVMEFVLVFHHL